MKKKLGVFLCIIASVFFLVQLRFNSNIHALVDSSFPVHNVDTNFNYTTIQEAIDANETLDGHTIFVEEGIYYEHVRVKKSLTLIGANRSTTIIDGYRAHSLDDAMKIKASNVKVTGFTIRNTYVRTTMGGYGVYVTEGSVGNNISYNKISSHRSGVYLKGTSNNTIFRNDISGMCTNGIYLTSSSDNIISENGVTRANVGIELYESSNNTISGNNITNNGYWGIYLSEFSDHNSISGNNITYNSRYVDGGGIKLTKTKNNTICENNIATNGLYGIKNTGSSEDTFYHNNLMDNPHQVSFFQRRDTRGYADFWDNGFEGNYWSDYNGTDLDGDGIGDTPYVINANNTDNYPLMGMFSKLDITSEHYVQTVCNSSISDFQFNGTAISFTVTGENGTTGFCRICIPKDLIDSPYIVFVNGEEASHTLLPCSNSTHSYLYFAYDHSTQEILISQESPTFETIQLLIVATALTLIAVTLVIIVYRRKHSM